MYTLFHLASVRGGDLPPARNGSQHLLHHTIYILMFPCTTTLPIAERDLFVLSFLIHEYNNRAAVKTDTSGRREEAAGKGKSKSTLPLGSSVLGTEERNP